MYTSRSAYLFVVLCYLLPASPKRRRYVYARTPPPYPLLTTEPIDLKTAI